MFRLLWALGMLVALAGPLAGAVHPAAPDSPLDRINHLVVFYQQNHSFDNYLGTFPGADGIANAGAAALQLDRQGQPYAVLPAPLARRGYVDHTTYDTTSILRTVEARWGLEPLGTRDANANDLGAALDPAL